MRTIDVIQAINDGLALQAAFAPLVKSALESGSALPEEVSDEAIAAARAKLDADIARVEAKVQAMPG